MTYMISRIVFFRKSKLLFFSFKYYPEIIFVLLNKDEKVKW